MFKLPDPNTPREVDWPVTIAVPVDGGGTQAHRIIVRFKLIDHDRISELTGDGDPLAALAGGRDEVMAFLQEVIAGWRHVEAADGTALPFTPDNLRLLLNVSYVRPPLLNAFFQCAAGRRPKLTARG